MAFGRSYRLASSPSSTNGHGTAVEYNGDVFVKQADHAEFDVERFDLEAVNEELQEVG